MSPNRDTVRSPSRTSIFSVISAAVAPSPTLTALSALGLAAFLTLGATGCGKSMVKGVDFKTEVQGDSVYASLSTAIDLGKIQLPALSIPIGGTLGTLALTNVQGQNRVSILIDVTRALRTSGMASANLPNGNALPLALGAGSQTLAFSAGGSSRVYLSVNGSDILIGYALVVSQLDAVGRVVPIAVDLFPQFAISKTLSGVSGFFTSPAAGQSGLAFFVRSQGAIDAGAAQTLIADAQADSVGGAFRAARLNSLESFDGEKAVQAKKASTRDVSRVEQSLIRLQSRGGTVSVQ